MEYDADGPLDPEKISKYKCNSSILQNKSFLHVTAVENVISGDNKMKKTEFFFKPNFETIFYEKTIIAP